MLQNAFWCGKTINMKKAILILILMFGWMGLSACGRMSAVTPPEGAVYPYDYAVQF